MSHHHDRHSQRFVELADQIHDLGAGVAVEIAGGLVRQQKLRLIDQRSRQRRPLLLAAGKFAGAVGGATAQADAFQRLPRKRSALAAVHFGKTQRQFHIFSQGHPRNQVERLKDHSDGAQAIFCQFLARKPRQVSVFDDYCSRGGPVKAGDQIQQGRLA